MKTTNQNDLQLRRLTIFSSGVGYYEYGGEAEGDRELVLPFGKNAVNDVLKSLVIANPGASPSVSYHSQQTLEKTLKGLSIDLCGNGYLIALLDSLKGAEIEVLCPTPLKGKIMLAEYRLKRESNAVDEYSAYLSLLTDKGVRVVSLQEISGFTFGDPQIQADADRALDLIRAERDADTISLAVRLPGQNARKISLSYVVPAPVWKVSYRLDLSRENPFLQGWAIVDNDSSMEWEEVELALVTGRPVSFIQNLYAPYHLSRPTIPLAIAGYAKAQTYEGGYPPAPPQPMAAASAYYEMDELAAVDEDWGGGYEKALVAEAVPSYGRDEMASGRAAGEQFEYTIKDKVSLARQQSAMLPLVEGAVSAKKMLFYRADGGRRPAKHPAIGAELVNDTGMKLPAGPITVYDGGTYAGDALIEFFPEGEKRFISYGEDLSVKCWFDETWEKNSQIVAFEHGMVIHKGHYTRCFEYVFTNASRETKRLVVEQPIHSPSARLTSPECMEKTSTDYRFELELPPGELRFKAYEEEPLCERVVVSEISVHTLLDYASNQEIAPPVRAELQRVAKLGQKLVAEKDKLAELNSQLERLYAEQERLRKNLEAAGNQTQQGQAYLKRLAASEDEITATNTALTKAMQAEKTAREEYFAYIKAEYAENGYVFDESTREW
jgi:hypothetical protein